MKLLGFPRSKPPPVAEAKPTFLEGLHIVDAAVRACPDRALRDPAVAVLREWSKQFAGGVVHKMRAADRRRSWKAWRK